MDEFFGGVIVGAVVTMIIAAIVITGQSDKAGCNNLATEQNIVWIEEIEECRLIDDNGNAVQFELVPLYVD